MSHGRPDGKYNSGNIATAIPEAKPAVSETPTGTVLSIPTGVGGTERPTATRPIGRKSERTGGLKAIVHVVLQRYDPKTLGGTKEKPIVLDNSILDPWYVSTVRLAGILATGKPQEYNPATCSANVFTELLIALVQDKWEVMTYHAEELKKPVK